MTSIIRKVLAALAAFALVSIPGIANAEGWNFPDVMTVPSGTTLIAINESSYFDVWNSWSSFKKGPFDGRGPESHICPNGPDEKNCNPANFRLEADSILPFCSSETSENCVEGLKLKTKDGDWVSGQFMGMSDGYSYPGKPEINLTPAGNPSLFKVPGVPHAFNNGETYAVVFKVKQIFDEQTSKYKSLYVNSVVIPYTLRPGGFPAIHAESPGPDGITRIGTRHDSSCTWSGSNACGVAEDFTPGTRVQLSVRLSNQVAGWFRGRITNPDASIKAFSASNNLLTMTADPVSVPRFAAYATKETTTPAGLELIKNAGGHNPDRTLFTGQSIKDFWATNYKNFEIIDEFRAATKDTAAGISSLWNFSTIESANYGCLKDTDKVMGVVSTNATVYNGLTPDFNSSTGELTYKVAGLHYAPDGKSLNEGTYDLVMRSDLARCLYGFSKAPISAKINVVSDSGETKVATTVVKEENGWITLRAAGFTFSSPTISIKLTQASAKKTTITCTKGKLVKKVTAVGPKCPAGYKKK